MQTINHTVNTNIQKIGLFCPNKDINIWDILDFNFSCKFYFIILFYLFCGCGDWCGDILAWLQEDGHWTTIGNHKFLIVQIMFEINLQ